MFCHPNSKVGTMQRLAGLACAILVTVTAGAASARSIGSYSGCKPLGKYKQACLDCVGGGNFWQSGQNICGLQGASKSKSHGSDDDSGANDGDEVTGSTGGGGLGILSGLWLTLLGLLGAASVVVAKQPKAAAAFARLAPYQGWIGAVSTVWGLWGVLSSIWHVGWLPAAPVFWILLATAATLQVALGLLLGVGVIQRFVKHNKTSAAMNVTVLTLGPHQPRLGIASVAVGMLLIVFAVF